MHLTKAAAATVANIVAATSRIMRGGEYGSHDPANTTPNGNVDRKGGGAVASMRGPGRYWLNAASDASEMETSAVTGSSNDVGFDSVSSEEPFIMDIVPDDEWMRGGRRL